MRFQNDVKSTDTPFVYLLEISRGAPDRSAPILACAGAADKAVNLGVCPRIHLAPNLCLAL
jgi:hypothetical protein